MNEICANCGCERSCHYIANHDCGSDEFTPSGRVAVPVEFVEEVMMLIKRYCTHPITGLVVSVAKPLAAMLDQMEKE